MALKLQGLSTLLWAKLKRKMVCKYLHLQPTGCSLLALIFTTGHVSRIIFRCTGKVNCNKYSENMNKSRLSHLVAAVLLLAGCTNSRPEPTSSPVVSITSSPSASADMQTEVSSATTAFYDEYSNCMTNPPKEAQGEVGNYCASHNSQATPSLPANLVAGGVAQAGADPIVCAQNFPISYSVTSSEFNSGTNSGVASLTEKFGAGDVVITVELRYESNKMLVDNIVCPKP
jgi:hypothetical protein